MNKKLTVGLVAILGLIAIVSAVYFQFLSPKDKCTNRDREVGNCVPAGKCGPTPELDATIDCEVKNYDKKFNTEL